MDKAVYRACSGRPFWWVRPGVGYGFMLVFCGVLFCVDIFCLFYCWFFLFAVLVVSFSQKSNCLVWDCLSTFDFLVFYSFFFGLMNCLQKNKLSSS